MTPSEHRSKIVLNTGPMEYNNFHTTTVSEAIVHAAIGISTEAGELLDAVKKSMIYGKPFDVVNGDEEVGDVLWYVNLYCEYRGTTIEQLLDMNGAKLMKRYPDQFSQEAALNRDTDAERAILEQHSDAG